MIELRGVTKMFGPKKAVDQLDLTVRAGELFAFLGPNGAGKTTTIKMVCGLLAPTAGIVRVGGYLAASQEARQLLAYVPDQPYLYEKLTGREFLRFVVEMYGLERRQADARLAELIETFEMNDFVDELCENYSQGMKQRVVFASALVHNPKVLIVDEPLVGLDPRSARIVKTFSSPRPARAWPCSCPLTSSPSPRNWPTRSGSSTTAGCSPEEPSPSSANNSSRALRSKTCS